MGNIISDNINEWYSKTKSWQKEATHYAFTVSKISDKELENIYDICLTEFNIVNNQLPSIKQFIYNEFSLEDKRRIAKIKKIYDIRGVGALSAETPLCFNDNLTIIYGENGSGKTSYIKLLKNICRNKGMQEIKGNVFSDKKINPSACVEIETDDKSEIINWTIADVPSTELCAIQIYDSFNAAVYINKDNDLVFEPELISRFTKLVEIFENIKIKLENDQKGNDDILENIPEPMKQSSWFIKFGSIKYKDEIEVVKNSFKLSGEEENEYEILKESLLNRNSEEEIAKLYKTQKFVIDLKNKYENLHLSLDEKIENSIREAIKLLSINKKAADDAATSIFSESIINGVGSDTWKVLWEQARKYSQEFAYINDDFPNTGDNGVCVLCHQPFVDSAITRMHKFEEFVKSGIETELKNTEELLGELLKALPQIELFESTKLKIELFGLSSEYEKIEGFHKCFIERENSLANLVNTLDDIIPCYSLEEMNGYFNALENEIRMKLITYSNTKENREKQQTRMHELTAKKWFYENENVLSIKIISEKYNLALKSTNTNTISILNSFLSEHLITKDYVKNFRKELENLGATKIKVELVKSKAIKGKVFHKIILKGAKIPEQPQSILSEGEYKVVSIAAFIAESEMVSKKHPIIFDDPISSLDNKYEEKVIDRIVKLSADRQIIVFSHRLAFTYMISDSASNNKCKYQIICLRLEPLGEPSDGLPISQQKLLPAINDIIKCKIPQLEKRKLEKDYIGFDEGRKALCSDIRVAMENGIENTLFHNVVKRFSREIQSKQLRYLGVITTEDINTFDMIISKYSYDVHSQPGETPREIPEISEILADMLILKDKIDDLHLRQKKMDKS